VPVPRYEVAAMQAISQSPIFAVKGLDLSRADKNYENKQGQMTADEKND
jgi:hypothetical protein